MAKLKLDPIVEDKPVKVTVELPGPLHRDLAAYAEMMARVSGQPPPEPAKLIPPMLARFMATDREFVRQRRKQPSQG